jgi:hypothetical protein
VYLGFTLREEDGTEHRTSTWTNSSPGKIDNVKLAHKDTNHVKEIFSFWEESLLHKDDDDDYTYWSCHEPFLAPSEYGLVVVDFVNNKILDCNGYHLFGAITATSVSIEINTIEMDDDFNLVSKANYNLLSDFTSKHKDSPPRLYDFYKERRIKDFVVYNQRTGRYDSIGENLNDWTIEQIADLIKNGGDKSRFGHFVLDMSPFEVITFPQNRIGYAAQRQAILDLGFVLTEEEEQIWKEAIEES